MDDTNNQQTLVQTKGQKALSVLYRAIVSFIGVVFIAIGATFLKESGWGLDPFTALNIGLSKHIGLGLGPIQLGFNVILFIIVLIADRKQIGIGTFFNMILVGYGIQFFSMFYQDHTAESTGHIPIIIVNIILGMLAFTLGTSLYMEANLGVAPYDAIAPIIAKHTKIQYKWIRSTQDILFMVLGFFAGGAVGVITIVVAFFAGSIINFWNVHVSHKIVASIYGFTSSQKKIKHVGTGIVHAGLNGINAIRSAYRYTNEMERNMSIYSPKQLNDILHDTQHRIHLNQLENNTLQQRYQSVKREINERDVSTTSTTKDDNKTTTKSNH